MKRALLSIALAGASMADELPELRATLVSNARQTKEEAIEELLTPPPSVKALSPDQEVVWVKWGFNPWVLVAAFLPEKIYAKK